MRSLIQNDKGTPEISGRDRADRRRCLRRAFIDDLYVILERKGITQRQLRDDLGWSSHTYMNRWRNLVTEPDPEEVFALEEYLEIAPGTLSRHLGYLPVAVEKQSRPAGFEAIVTADEILPDWGKEILLTSYRQIMKSLGRSRQR